MCGICTGYDDDYEDYDTHQYCVDEWVYNSLTEERDELQVRATVAEAEVGRLTEQVAELLAQNTELEREIAQLS